MSGHTYTHTHTHTHAHTHTTTTITLAVRIIYKGIHVEGDYSGDYKVIKEQ